jgi:ubiquinone/menaquinone biosynthesis C-methylase UbiE
MPSLPVIKQLVAEMISRKDAFRVPEPDLVMEDSDQVAAFHTAGRENGVMAPVYLFHAAQVCEVIKPGDTVLDLGCGPANQLGLIARLNPDVRFTGVDLSSEMLAMAGRNLQARGIANVTLQNGDITDLCMFDEASVDVVMSTVVLHHLPDDAALFRCFEEVRRVLKPGGGLYLVDFGHLKTEAAIRYFAYQYQESQPELFTIDYLNSLRAAFELATWRDGWSRYLKEFGAIFSTFAVPYMVAVKSPTRRSLTRDLLEQLSHVYRDLPPSHKTDFKDLATFFKLGGLRTPAFPR